MAEFHVERADGTVAGFTDQAKADTYAAGIGGTVVEVVDVDGELVASEPGNAEQPAPVTAD